ncbi:MAG TPA: enolase C-terminal domain-like protein [Bauldia sp.]|nr:enolase C-terminal domain-like protein [Bauldia sp.]
MPRRRVTIATAPIPFRVAFKHASATRRVAENVIVRIEDDDGLVGLGEGCPRAYVTGETVATALRFLERRAPTLAAEIDSVAAIASWIEGDEEIDANPSAACAIELALLDLIARRAELPVERIVGLESLVASPHATAVYGDSVTPVFLLQALIFGWRGVRDAKLKLSGDPRRDRCRARMLSRRGPLRLDANNLWPDAGTAIASLAPLAPLAWAVEEPVKVRDFAAMAEVSRETGLEIILDESFLSVRDLDALPTDGKFAVNVRVSKDGGLLRTISATRAARARALKVIVGAQVGETSILARAGLAAVSAAGDALAGYEGGYGTHLLARDITSPSLTIGRHGAIPAEVWAATKKPGLGLDLAPDAPLFNATPAPPH